MRWIIILCSTLVLATAEQRTVEPGPAAGRRHAPIKVPMGTAAGLIPPCGQPGLQPCCTPHPTAGCQDPICCQAVCTFDKFCCQGEWDTFCAQNAQVLCAGLCCSSDPECRNPDPCVVGFCEPLLQECVYKPLPPDAICETDGDLCTQEACNNAGTCVLINDINDSCLRPVSPCAGGEFCDPALGVCVPLPPAPPGTACDLDGLPCTLEECDGLGDCLPIGSTDHCESACPFCNGPCDPKTGLCPCAEARQDGLWSQDIWNLPGPNPYPDNNGGIPNLGAVVAGVGVLLDLSVEIVSLCVLDLGTLRPLQELGPGGRHVTVIGPEGILIANGGSLLVSGAQIIDATAGAVTVGGAGTYSADPDAGGPVSALLTAGTLEIIEGDPGGLMNLSGQMDAESLGNFIMDGATYDDKGDCTPPDLILSDAAAVAVAGDFIMQNAASVTHTSSAAMTLVGSFVNQGVFPQFFDFAGRLLMSRTGSQNFENGGEDRGRCATGFVDNFAIGTLELIAGTHVNIVDVFDNQQDGETTCDEALYVDQLIVGSGATLSTLGCPVYYRALTNGGSIPGLGTDVREIVKADLNGDCVVNAADLAQLLGAWGPCDPPCPPTCPEDLNGDCTVNATDLAQLLGAWGSTD